MSETVGLHTQITADSGNFTQAMENARRKLADFAVQEKELKNGIAEAEQNLKKQSAQFGKDSTEAKKARAALADLYRKELELKSGVKAVTDDVNRQTQAFAKNADEAKNVVSATGQIANGFNILKGLALGYAGKTLFSAFVGSNADFEQSLVSFEVLLGSAEKANKLMADLNKFGAETPFELPELTQATTQLLSFGTAEEDVMTKLHQLGDLSMGNAEKLDRITNAYGKMLAKGKVSLEELNMFTEAGVPILKELQTQYGVTQEALFDMITKGQVNIDGINAAMQGLTSEGGKFFGMMEKQSQTAAGLWSTLSDNINIFAREVGKESFNYLKGELADLMSTIRELEDSGELSEIAAEIGEGVAGAVTFIGNFIKLLWETRDVLIAVGSGVAIYKTSLATLTTVVSGVNAAKTLFNILAGKSVVCKNLETGATVTLTKAEAADVMAKNSAIVAQSKLNAVISANPYMAVAAAVLALVSALAMYAKLAGDAENETNNLSNEVKELSDQYKELKDSSEKANAEIKNSTDKTVAQMQAAKALIPELETLINKTDRTSEENNRLKQIIEQLNSAFPDLRLAIDEQTGALNIQIDTLYKAADAWIAYARAQGAAQAISSRQQQIIDTQLIVDNSLQNIDKIDKQIKDIDKVLADPATGKYRQGYKPAGMTDDEYTALLIKRNALLSSKEEAGKTGVAAFDTIETTQKEIDSINAKYNPYNADGILEDTLRSLGLGDRVDKTNTPTGTKTNGTTKKSSSNNAENERKAKVSAYKAVIQQFEENDERAHKRGLETGEMTIKNKDGTEETIQYTERIYADSLKARAGRYREHIEEIKTLDYMTDSEKNELIRTYTQKAEDLELEAYKYNKNLRKQDYEERRADSDEWIEQKKKEGNYDEVIAGLERVKAYTKEYYDEGIYSAEEYQKLLKDINKEIANTQKEAFNDQLSDSRAYIAKMNKYDEWDENGDNEVAAWQRVQANIQKAYDEGVIGWKEFIALFDETNEAIRDATEADMQAQIAEEEQLLKEKYQQQYEAERKALEEKLELTREYAEKEKQEIRDRAQAELDAIDKLIEARKRAKEDEDDNLKLQRLKNKLEYEMDVDNRLALQKEIAKLEAEIDDKLFNREMADRKEAINAKMDADLKEIEAAYDRKISNLEYDIQNAEEKYKEQTSGAYITQQIYKNLGFSELEKLAAELGGAMDNSMNSMVNQALKTMHANLNEMAGITGSKSHYHYSTTNETNYSPTYNINGGANMTPSEIAKMSEAQYKRWKHLRNFTR